MKKLLWLIGLLFIFLVETCFAAGTVVQSNTQSLGNNMYKMRFTCTADSSDGSFPATASFENVDGWLQLMVTNPSGVTAPQASYDITLIDGDTADVLGGVGVDRSATATEAVQPGLGNSSYGERFVSGVVTVTIINNNVNSAVTVIDLYIRRLQ